MFGDPGGRDLRGMGGEGRLGGQDSDLTPGGPVRFWVLWGGCSGDVDEQALATETRRPRLVDPVDCPLIE